MSEVQCPATMCPLIAKDGSPWTGEYGGVCPEHADLDFPRDDARCGCPWWEFACSVGGIQGLVEEAARDRYIPVLGPNQPRRPVGAPREFDCPKAGICSWQKQATVAGRNLCPPRDALSRGIDPRVCLF